MWVSLHLLGCLSWAVQCSNSGYPALVINHPFSLLFEDYSIYQNDLFLNCLSGLCTSPLSGCLVSAQCPYFSCCTSQLFDFTVFFGILYIFYLRHAAQQRPALRTVSFQVATHLESFPPRKELDLERQDGENYIIFLVIEPSGLLKSQLFSNSHFAS
jgi:hypothetical protein